MATVAHLTSSTLTRGSDGWRQQVDYLVTDPGGPDHLLSAVLATPPHGSESPSIPGIFALDYSARYEQEDPKAVRVSVVYRLRESDNTNDNPDPGGEGVGSQGTVQVGARLQSVKRTKDVFGNQIVTQHLATENDSEGNPIEDNLITQPAEVDALLPTTILTVTRTESASPQTKAKDNVGHLNLDTFAGEDPGLWLCTSIEGVTNDGGLSYQVTYEFEYRAEGWQATVIFIKPDTNKPPENPQNGTEIQSYTIYPSADFGALQLGV